MVEHVEGGITKGPCFEYHVRWSSWTALICTSSSLGESHTSGKPLNHESISIDYEENSSPILWRVICQDWRVLWGLPSTRINPPMRVIGSGIVGSLGFSGLWFLEVAVSVVGNTFGEECRWGQSRIPVPSSTSTGKVGKSAIIEEIKLTSINNFLLIYLNPNNHSNNPHNPTRHRSQPEEITV